MGNEPMPHELGMPEKFESWRPSQWSCIENGVTCADRFDAHCVPTGGGKSPSYMAMVSLLYRPGRRMAIVTATKGLQDQVMQDFAGAFPIVNIMGKSNYTCTARPNWTCEDGHAGRCPNAGTVNCAHSKVYFDAIISPVVLTNYSFWIAVHKYGHGLGTFDHLILDEAHQAFRELSGAVQLQVSSNEIEEMLGLKFPHNKDNMERWKSWAAGSVRQAAKDAAKEVLGKINGAFDVKQSWVREYQHLRNLVHKLGTLATVRPANWIVDDWEHGFQFDAIKPSGYAEQLLYLKIPRVSFFSATMTPKVLHMNGVWEGYQFWEYPSVFSPEGNPVMHVPTCYVNRDMTPTDISMWLLRADQIIGARGDRRGLFHTVSHDRRDVVFHRSDYARWMHTNKRGDNTTEVIERYLRAEPPAVCVSPSIMTGWDFMYDAARYQIVGKVPWPNIGTKLFKAREAYDPLYGPTIAAQNLVQACGRIRRAEDDWGETFIIDDGVWRFLNRYSGLFASWFKKCYRNVDCIPRPPKLDNRHTTKVLQIEDRPPDADTSGRVKKTFKTNVRWTR